MAGRPKQNKPQLPSLDTGPLPLRGFRDAARRQLIDLIDSKRGKKALVLDPSLSGPLTLLDARLSELLSEHGVAKMLYLERRRLDDPTYSQSEPRLSGLRPVMYIARATLDNAQLIAWQVKNTPRAAQDHEFSVLWVPRRSVACEKLLEDEGVAGDMAQAELPLDVVPLDDDLLSLELDRPFADCTLDGDASPLFAAARAVARLQHEFGLIPRVQGKGPAAAAVRDILFQMRRERPPPRTAPGAPGPRISRVILLDRECDLVTPVMTQITFEGLIDEITGIRHGAVPLGSSSSSAAGGGSAGGSDGGSSAGPSGRRGGAGGGSTLLNSSDPFFAEFRDLPYYTASQRLTRYAREARRDYGELGTKDLSELKSFVKGLPKLLLLDRLSDLLVPVAEVVKQPSFHRRLKVEMDLIEGVEVEEAVGYIQELIWSGAEVSSVLRLLVLLSVTQGGVPRRHWDGLRGEIVSAYGHQHLLTLHNLEAAGLLRAHQGGGGLSSTLARGAGAFPALRKALRLAIPDDESSMNNPTDISHLYKGYAPLTIRMVEAALSGGWAALSETLVPLPGAHFDVAQIIEPSGQISDRPWRAGDGGSAVTAAAGTVMATSGSGGDTAGGSSAADGGSGSDGKETVLVVFLGGATFTELSALRFLARRPGSNARFLSLVSRVVNGRTLIEGFVDPLSRDFPGGAGGRGGAAGVAAGRVATAI